MVCIKQALKKKKLTKPSTNAKVVKIHVLVASSVTSYSRQNHVKKFLSSKVFDLVISSAGSNYPELEIQPCQLRNRDTSDTFDYAPATCLGTSREI